MFAGSLTSNKCSIAVLDLIAALYDFVRTVVSPKCLHLEAVTTQSVIPLILPALQSKGEFLICD